MEFVRVTNHDPRTCSNLWPLMRWRVSVINAGIDTNGANQLELLKHFQLIIRECFRWIDVKRSRVMVAVELLKNWYVERERFARSGGGGDNDIFAFAQRNARFDLVTVQPNALFKKVGMDVWRDLLNCFSEDRFSGRQYFGVRNLPAEHSVGL